MCRLLLESVSKIDFCCNTKLFLRLVLVLLVSFSVYAFVPSPSQKPEELAYQLAKFYSLSGSKEIFCERLKEENPAPGESIDYGFFTLRGEMDRLLFNGNPGMKVGSVELNINEVVTANFLNSSRRFVATIDASPSTGIFEKGRASGSLLKMENGSVTHVTKLNCKLK